MSTAPRTSTTERPTRPSRAPRTARSGTLATGLWAASVPLLIVGQFALLAVVPVLVVLFRTVRRPRLHALRPWALGLTSTYAVALLLWAVGPNRARSLSKDLHPAVAGLIIAAAAGVVVRCAVQRRVNRVADRAAEGHEQAR